MAVRRIATILMALTIPALVSIGSASALDYPTHPVRFVVGYPAGGSTDILARAILQPLTEILGKPVIIDNKSGAGGIIGTTEAARAAPSAASQHRAPEQGKQAKHPKQDAKAQRPAAGSAGASPTGGKRG